MTVDFSKGIQKRSFISDELNNYLPINKNKFSSTTSHKNGTISLYV